MKERPILFSGPMVRAILDGRKTQTRRLCNPQPSLVRRTALGWRDNFGLKIRPNYQPGDRLWVRETLRISERSERGINGTHLVSYAATHVPVQIAGTDERQAWAQARIDSQIERAHDGFGVQMFKVPSIFMPRWASRITLEVIRVRVERLQEISEADAAAEGFPILQGGNRVEFRALWDSLNAKRAPWESNPWVWVVEFRILPTGNRR